MSRAVSCTKSKVGLLQTAHSWANAGVLFGARVDRRVAFETIKLIHAKVLCTIFDINYHPNIARVVRRVAFETIKLIHAKVLCTIFDKNYHPNIAHINMQGASVLVLT